MAVLSKWKTIKGGYKTGSLPGIKKGEGRKSLLLMQWASMKKHRLSCSPVSLSLRCLSACEWEMGASLFGSMCTGLGVFSTMLCCVTDRLAWACLSSRRVLWCGADRLRSRSVPYWRTSGSVAHCWRHPDATLRRQCSHSRSCENPSEDPTLPTVHINWRFLNFSVRFCKLCWRIWHRI